MVAAVIVSLAVLQCNGFPEAKPVKPKSLNVLVFSKTAGYRHDSIPDANAAIQKICDGQKWTCEHTEDSSSFSKDHLSKFDVVVFALTTGDVLNDDQQKAFEAFIKTGGGYVGIHAASDTEYDWPWYGKLVGAWFKGHPAIQQATVHIEDKKHKSTKMLPDPWKRADEWYSFKTNPRSDVHVLASLDETSYQGGLMGPDHPIMWCHDFDGGRAWYTAMGHVKESYADPLYLSSLKEGILWAAGKSKRR